MNAQLNIVERDLREFEAHEARCERYEARERAFMDRRVPELVTEYMADTERLSERMGEALEYRDLRITKYGTTPAKHDSGPAIAMFLDGDWIGFGTWLKARVTEETYVAAEIDAREEFLRGEGK